jgi:hypothetical protein
MGKLSFEYDESSGYPAISRASYRGLTIEAIQDESPSNPWTDSDGFAPLLWYSLGGGSEEHGNADLTAPLAAFSDAAISRHWRKLCAILAPDVDADALSSELAKARRDNPPQWRGSLSELKREALEERLNDMAPAGHRSWPVDYVDALEELWTLAGCEALAFQRNGYSQGDSVLGLLVATPAWRKAMGIPAKRDLASDLRGQADIFGAYFWGDVYGVAIVAPDDSTLDSIWGFVGSDFEKSGLAEAGVELADSILADASRRRTAKAKELIRNRVPVAYRGAALEEAGKLESVF